jgi:hypothetical protein
MPRDVLPCPSGKTFHPSMESANRQLVSLKKDSQANGMHSYRCTLCNFFHVGHKPGIARGLRKKNQEKGK